MPMFLFALSQLNQASIFQSRRAKEEKIGAKKIQQINSGLCLEN